MKFSDLFKQNNHLCKFSPNGQLLANCVQYRLIIRDIWNLQILQLYTCLDAVQYIEWSSDPKFVLCGMFKRGIVQVWSLEQSEWTCKIDEGSAGLKAVQWSPDGRHLLTTADFHIRITHFATDTKDLCGLEWSPDGRVLGVWDSLLEYNLLLYSVDGRCIATFRAYEYALGIKSVCWSPSSQFLAIGSFDEKVRILNHITWKTVVEHPHPPVLYNTSVVIYKEVEQRPKIISNNGASSSSHHATLSMQSKYEILESSVQIPVLKPDPDKPNPKIGISLLSFSPDNRYMASKNDNMPNALWVWDVQKLCQSVLLLQVGNIKCAEWNPVDAQLAICTGNNKLYIWSPAGCVSVEVPAESSFQVNQIKWHPEGKAILLSGKDQMCLCFLDEDT